uniref:Uncharacterized protein n=1 Tax=Anguilla anguilla TaxID=7936 RepID=A0A0E9WRW8_ANGAN
MQFYRDKTNEFSSAELNQLPTASLNRPARQMIAVNTRPGSNTYLF